jgi:hypothetical protein
MRKAWEASSAGSVAVLVLEEWERSMLMRDLEGEKRMRV